MTISLCKEKKSLEIKGFIGNTLLDWEGKIACEIFLPYCNFRCPWLFQKQEKIVSPYINEDSIAMDFGCGMGYYDIYMARTLTKGKVIAVDIQEKMLKVLIKRAMINNCEDRICPCKPNNIYEKFICKVDFVVSSWVFHELDNKEKAFELINSYLKPKGKFLLMEPNFIFHDKKSNFLDSVEMGVHKGFKKISMLKISLNYSVLFEKMEDCKHDKLYNLIDETFVYLNSEIGIRAFAYSNNHTLSSFHSINTGPPFFSFMISSQQECATTQ
ncbi:methyltransferase domain-containing protein [bacterium]